MEQSSSCENIVVAETMTVHSKLRKQNNRMNSVKIITNSEVIQSEYLEIENNFGI